MFSYNEIPVFDHSPHQSHIKIINSVLSGSRVLDIGCASGYLAAKLKKKNCSVFGIELDPDFAKQATQYCDKVIVADIENMEEELFSVDYFDVIIFADILEHLKRPDLVLLNLRKYLKTDGIVIASIPNIARLEIRIKLLCGRFDYSDHGILNVGHLRFFTLKTAKELFERTGYSILDVQYTGLGSKFRILPTFLSFQFVFTVRKVENE